MSSPQAAPGEAEEAVLATLNALFDAIANRDEAVMREILMPDGASTHVRDGQILHFQLKDLPARWAAEGASRQEELIHQPVIHVDENIAVVWAPYDVFVDGVARQWGTNIVSFVKQDGRWRISGVTDNGRGGSRPSELFITYCGARPASLLPPPGQLPYWNTVTVHKTC